MGLQKIVSKIMIEMTGTTKRYAVSAKQGDRATRYVEIILLSNGEQYEIPEGSAVTAYIRKPDRKHVYTACTYDGSKVTLELTSQTLAAAGTAKCEIEVKSADLEQVITSVTLEIEIEPMVKDEGAILSSNEMSILDATLKQYTQAETLRVNAENERMHNETVRQQTEQKRVESENSRVNAETARKNAEAVRQNNEASRQQAETLRVNAENERKNNETSRQQAEILRANAENERQRNELYRQQAEQNRVESENSRANAETARENAEAIRQQSTSEALKNAQEAVNIANQINEASCIMDADTGTKYAYAIYAAAGKPHMSLTKIAE